MGIIKLGSRKSPERLTGMVGSEISVGVGGIADGTIVDTGVVVGKNVVGSLLMRYASGW